MNCPTCSRTLEPATLNPKNKWCSVCAQEFNPSGGPVVRKSTLPPVVGEVKLDGPPPLESASPSAPAAGDLRIEPRFFRVSVGAVSFTVAHNTELDIAGTKVVITAL